MFFFAGTLTSFADIRKHYVCSKIFALDLFCALPFEIFALTAPPGHTERWRLYDYLRLNRIFKALEVLYKQPLPDLYVVY